jgi:hypothetical protein
MSLRKRAYRFGWLFAAALQLVLPAAVSVVDARAEAESIVSAPRVHVESDGATGCPRVHPADCALCRVLAATATADTPPRLHVPVARFIDATTDVSNRVAYAARFPGDPPQRAPPVLS